MNKLDLIEILQNGVNYGGNYATDTHKLGFENGNAVCSRFWDYDDYDMNDDYGNSKAVIPRQEVEEFLDAVLEAGTATRIFDSVNSYHSQARYSEGNSERFDEESYEGKTELSITLEQDKVIYRFKPTPPENFAKNPVRLDNRDYLTV